MSTLRAMAPCAPECPKHLSPQMLPYQMLALYALAARYNVADARILEIGTGHGASAFMLARAAPNAKIVTLGMNPVEAGRARQALRSLGLANVDVIVARSDDFYRSHTLPWQMIFVDGDHNDIRNDLRWWARLLPGGLFLFHDYSPAGSAHASPVVYAALGEFLKTLGRDEFDIRIVDDTQTGMAGVYR